MGKVAVIGLLFALVLNGFTPSASANGALIDPPATNCTNDTDAVLLTFDDWPYESTRWRFETFVSILQRNETTGFFFTIKAPNLELKFPDHENFLRSKGMWVGNHSTLHPHLTQLSDAQIREELANGVKSNVFRAPYGDTNARVEQIGRSLGMRHCGWDTRSLDTTAKGDTVEEIKNNVLREVRPGSVVLMHLHTKAIYALQGVIDGIKAKGLRLCRPQPPTTEVIPANLPC